MKTALISIISSVVFGLIILYPLQKYAETKRFDQEVGEFVIDICYEMQPQGQSFRAVDYDIDAESFKCEYADYSVDKLGFDDQKEERKDEFVSDTAPGRVVARTPVVAEYVPFPEIRVLVNSQGEVITIDEKGNSFVKKIETGVWYKFKDLISSEDLKPLSPLPSCNEVMLGDGEWCSWSNEN